MPGALTHADADEGAEASLGALAPGSPVPPAQPTAPEVRAWAATQGIEVATKGRVPAALRAAYDEAHRSG